MSSSMLRPFWASLVVLTLGLAPAQADPADEVLAAMNVARAKAGCGPLSLNPRLMKAAEGHARAMAEKDFFGHTGRDGSKISSRLRRQGYRYSRAAENIAAGQNSAGQVIQSWLNSPGHRKNILNCALTETGIAVAYQPEDEPMNGNSKPFLYYWVQVFAAPG